MKTIAISQFKTHALKIVDQIAQDHEVVVITKRGKPLARVVPYVENEPFAEPGQLADTFVFEGDIVSPLGEDLWEACS